MRTLRNQASLIVDSGQNYLILDFDPDILKNRRR
jgi:hypothetical protein